MQSKQDQLHAHLFVLGRVVSALTRGEPDAAEAPMRRFSAAAIGGILVAGLVVAGIAVWGLLFPGGGTAWREQGSLLVEKETGTRYVLLDDVLHPVANYASARLVLGPQTKVVSVAAKALNGIPHGQSIGIPGAPDALPAAKSLVGKDWLICSQSGSSNGTPVVRDEVALGGARPTVPPAADSALLVRTPDGSMYLAWHGRRLAVGGRASLVALGYGSAEPWPVSALWVSALLPGDALTAPDVPQRGEPGPQVGALKTRIGQLLETRTGPSETSTSHFLVLPDGLAPLSGIEAALVLGDPRTKDAYPGGAVAAIPVGASDAAAAPASKRSAPTGLPPAPPELTPPVVGRPRTPCVHMILRPDAAVESVEVALAQPDTGGRDGVAGRTPSGGPILLSPGSGMLAQPPVAAGDASTKAYLVTDLGVKYPLASLEAAGALGYSGPGAGMVTVPASLLDLLPTGPVLDPQAAASVSAPGK